MLIMSTHSLYFIMRLFIIFLLFVAVSQAYEAECKTDEDCAKIECGVGWRPVCIPRFPNGFCRCVPVGRG
ncbi:unnamed protein product [Bursaphelenchus xylophilus]|uniref:(pine wood nematode) hypothetical protein n=1 Tax=Bursaphelenchus xylophilus TaxID=6326 RepID=A0A7I8XF00_BURXY|nr:unnamed protein product [Bursaphelenchus xylophilus]CAG9080563.1 unnamed protein product [Bursaphelenchus xylophilus]